MSTFSANPRTVQRNWVLFDADNQVLGRTATRIASMLRGKHKPEYTPNVDAGDFVVVVNVEKLVVTGNKVEDKTYYRHTGYPGGIKSTSFGKLQAKFPARVLEIAVKGMLPKNALGRQMFRKLKIYTGSEHPHQAQNPKLYEES